MLMITSWKILERKEMWEGKEGSPREEGVREGGGAGARLLCKVNAYKLRLLLLSQLEFTFSNSAKTP